MQFTEKRLRVKWYGGLNVACRATPSFVRSGQTCCSQTMQWRFQLDTASVHSIQRWGCQAILTAVGCCKAQQSFITVSNVYSKGSPDMGKRSLAGRGLGR